ncbi:MAG: hypothetical protein PHX14_08485 [Syntrophomonadaceae bacterium]|nr:hypothetical protein [Syntrophomonadaceae bacterium]
MNKIKLMYDIARAMRDKDSLDGSVKLNLKKDGLEVFRLDNEFSRNLTSGWGKARILTVLDHEGKQLRHESNTEFNINQKQDNELRGCQKHRFFHGHHWGMQGISLRKRLDMIIAALNALNNMQVLEQEDQSIRLSLDLHEIPEDLKEAFRTRMSQKHHSWPGFLQGSPLIEKCCLEGRINNNYEIESITVKLEGKLQEENRPDEDLTLDAAVVLGR